jgi:hypothetical protein
MRLKMSVATPKAQHIPPRIRRKDFEAGYLKPGAYSIEDVSAAIVDHLNQAELSPHQLEALRCFKYEGRWSISQSDNIYDVRKFLEIFEEFFFHTPLRGH